MAKVRLFSSLTRDDLGDSTIHLSDTTIIRSATADDIISIERFQYHAFLSTSDNFWANSDRQKHIDDYSFFNLAYLCVRLQNTRYRIRIVEVSGTIAGFAIWCFQTPDGPPELNDPPLEIVEAWRKEGHDEPNFSFPDIQCKTFDSYRINLEPQIVSCDPVESLPEEHFLLEFFAVSAAYRKQGLGSSLIREGIAWAEKLEIPLYVGALDEAASFYRRHGFRDIKIERYVDERKGREATHLQHDMMRPLPKDEDEE